MITNTASSTEITVGSVKNVPTAVTGPIASRATCGKRCCGWRRPNGLKKTPSLAAL
jgi:hypothetical protein